VCRVKVTPDQVTAPRVSNKQRADGTMVSLPMEDLWPFLDREEFREQMIVPPID
jgi:acetolactate synthase-1/2/3 large subunit